MRLEGNHTLTRQRQPRARDRVWQSMRVMRTFTRPDLMATAEASEDNVSKYVRGLVRAGIVTIVKPRDSGRKGGHEIYRLIKDLGPTAPRLRSNGTTYDVNRREIHQGGIRQ